MSSTVALTSWLRRTARIPTFGIATPGGVEIIGRPMKVNYH
jgi:hypothetical protein